MDGQKKSLPECFIEERTEPGCVGQKDPEKSRIMLHKREILERFCTCWIMIVLVNSH